MIIPNAKKGTVNNANAQIGTIPTTCPGCGRAGVFHKVGVNDLAAEGRRLILRVCPNAECKTLVYMIIGTSGDIEASYPPLRIDFDATEVPNAVVETFEEALTCHANGCFVAAAIMVRRTLEEICEEKGAKGRNLRDRVQALGGQILIPQELLDGMDELRLLGNDAAHIEARVFDNIGKRELDVAIRFTKEILKAVYQYSALLRELQSLKTPQQSS